MPKPATPLHPPADVLALVKARSLVVMDKRPNGVRQASRNDATRFQRLVEAITAQLSVACFDETVTLGSGQQADVYFVDLTSAALASF